VRQRWRTKDGESAPLSGHERAVTVMVLMDPHLIKKNCNEMIAVAKRNEERRRELAVEAAKNNAEFVKDVLRRHNLSNTKTLKFEEVRQWLQVVGSAHSRSLPLDRATSLAEKNFPGMSAGLATLSSKTPCEVYSSGLSLPEQ
jgi:hypothetical protein